MTRTIKWAEREKKGNRRGHISSKRCEYVVVNAYLREIISKQWKRTWQWKATSLFTDLKYEHTNAHTDSGISMLFSVDARKTRVLHVSNHFVIVFNITYFISLSKWRRRRSRKVQRVEKHPEGNRERRYTCCGWRRRRRRRRRQRRRQWNERKSSVK